MILIFASILYLVSTLRDEQRRRRSKVLAACKDWSRNRVQSPPIDHSLNFKVMFFLLTRSDYEATSYVRATKGHLLDIGTRIMTISHIYIYLVSIRKTQFCYYLLLLFAITFPSAGNEKDDVNGTTSLYSCKHDFFSRLQISRQFRIDAKR